MQIDVRFHGLQSSDALKHHTVRRIHAELSRFGAEITSVVARIGDVNGPKGGADKSCRVHVTGPRIGSSIARELHEDPYSAVTLAVARIARAAGHRLDRARSLDSTRISVRRMEQ